MLAAPVSFLAPVHAGWVYDNTGNYTTAFITFAALATFATFLMCLVRPPKAQAELSTNVSKFM